MRLRRVLRTYSFRIMLLYVGSSGVSVLILFGVIYWVTAKFMEAQLRSAIATEMSSLVDELRATNIGKIADEISERVASPEHQMSFCLLQDAAGQRTAGNLQAMPAFAGWREFPIPPENGGEDSSDTLMAQGQQLPGGWFLLVGQDTDQFSDFEELILYSAGWSLAGAFALALVGGLTTGASMLRRVEAITGAGRDIGLSLVAAIAQLHRIAVEIADNRPGLRVMFRFPPSKE